MSFPERLAVIRDLVAIGAAISAILVTWLGLGTWKRQLEAKTVLEVARPLLRAVYKARDAIKSFRSALVPIGEIERAVQESVEKGGSEELTRERWQRHVYARRWTRVQEAMLEINAVGLEAETMWGADWPAVLEEFDTSVRLLYASLHTFLDLSEKTHLTSEERRRKETANRMIWADFDPDDEYGKRLATAVERVEAFLRPRMRRGTRC